MNKVLMRKMIDMLSIEALRDIVYNMLLSEDSICSIDSFGNKFWYNNNGLLHRVDGPAVEYSDGTELWFMNGLRHRTDGPAIKM